MQTKKAVGRPVVKNKRVTLSMKIKPELKEWLESHEISKGAMVEKLIEQELKRLDDVN
jgi:hypothetical protein